MCEDEAQARTSFFSQKRTGYGQRSLQCPHVLSVLLTLKCKPSLKAELGPWPCPRWARAAAASAGALAGGRGMAATAAPLFSVTYYNHRRKYCLVGSINQGLLSAFKMT